MTMEPEIEELKGAVGVLARAVEELAEAMKDELFGYTATRRAAADVSKTARNVADQLGGQPAQFGAVAVPEDVVVLVRAGKSLEAVTRYREVTGASLDEAKAVIRDIN